MLNNKSFVSKILLFGEYSVLKNSCALSIPYGLFRGQLKFREGGNSSQTIDSELSSLCRFLQKQQYQSKLSFDIDLHSFEFDISQGLYFHSSIPQGFGVGSSASLTAAVYDSYVNDKETNLSELKNHLGQIESHFHGASSGIDPLISYLETPIIKMKDSELLQVKIPSYKNGKGGLFLLNTGRPRRTEPLVNLFLEKSKSDQFNRLCENVLSPVTDECIENFLEGKIGNLFKTFKDLSLFQREHFEPMIPKLFLETWEKGFDSDVFTLKLCGAGGGGFLLGLTRDFSLLKNEIGGHEVRPLYYF